MSLSHRFVTLMLPPPYRRTGGILVGIAFTVAWIATLGMQTYATALLALTIIAMVECVRFTREHPTEQISVDAALGAAYAVFIALASDGSHLGITAVGTIVALSLYGYLSTRPPASLRWVARRLPGGLGSVVAHVIAGTASGLGGALVTHLWQRLSG